MFYINQVQFDVSILEITFWIASLIIQLQIEVTFFIIVKQEIAVTVQDGVGVPRHNLWMCTCLFCWKVDYFVVQCQANDGNSEIEILLND